jgi:hypothetical protein
MKINIKLLESNKEINNKIITAIISHLGSVINNAIPQIKNDIQGFIVDALKQEPEYQSLLNGVLRGEFGIPDTSIVEDIVLKLSQAIEITINPIKKSTTGVSGGITVNIIKSNDLSGVINDASAYVKDTDRGYSLPWLEWLALKGGEILVKNYSIDVKNTKNSRSGMAIMVSSSDSWRVPPAFAGTEDNNWITRALSTTISNITKSIQTHIEKNI